MANRLKEDERNEKIIRGLLKLPGNRRCINCNSLGPQYVCTNFWTFICTTCSGIHREYTHRVKSVSMAKFTSQEVAALQGGGNESAREVYFKEWDPQRHSIPDSSNVERLRDFIRHVYVDRRYTGERGMPPRAKMGEKEGSYESRRADASRGGSRSPSYGDDKIYRNNYDERRSPGYDQESRYANNYKKSPVRFEVVDDRQRDRFGNGRKFEDRGYPNGESKSEGRSPNRQMDTSSPPMVRPVRDILGEDVPPLRVGEPLKANTGKAADGLTQTQRTTSSSSLGSKDGGSLEPKLETPGSLIDFDADPAPSAATSGSPQQSTASPVGQPVTQPSPSVDGDNWASFGFASQAPSQPQAPSVTNTLESLLSQLSAPSPATATASNMSTSNAGVPTSPVGNMSTVPITSGSPTTIANTSTFPFSATAVAPLSGNIQSSSISSSVSPPAPGDMMSTLAFGGGNANEVGWPNMQQNHPSSFASHDSQSTAPQFTTSVQASSNQVIPATLPAHSEAKTSERKALPEDLFAATYSLAPVSVPGWHTGPSSGMGYGMQYPVAAPMQNFPQSSKPTNPFDLTSEPTIAHAPSLPSMTSLQGALPNVRASSGLVRSSSFGNPSLQWMPPKSQSYTSQVHSPSYVSTMHPSAYMGQVSSTMPPQGKQGSGSFGFETAFGNVSTDQQQTGRYSLPATPDSFSPHSGNPFG